MRQIRLFYAVLLAISVSFTVCAGDEDFIDPIRAGTASGITVYSSMLSQAPAAFARTHVMGTTGTKGIIGESIATNKFLQTTLQKTGNWYAISPRIGKQGIDHIFLKINPETAHPKGIIVGESKYNTSLLGKTKDGLQLTSHWTNPRLRAMGTRYYQLSQVTEVRKLPVFGGQHEMKIVLKNGKEVCFWRANSKDTWKFSGSLKELQEAQKLAKVYGQYLSAAGTGKVVYRSRLFQIVPKGNDITIVIKDASELDVLQRASKLPETQRIVLHDVLREKLPKDVEREIAKSLKGKFPSYSEKEIAQLAKKINSTAKDVLTPYGKLQMLGTFATHAGISSIAAVIIDASIQYFATKKVTPEKLLVTGGTVFLGTLGAQSLEVGLTQWSVTQGLFKSLGHALGCSTSLLGSAFSSATGAFFVGALLSYTSWYMGYVDLKTANRMTIASGIGIGLSLAAKWGTLAAISAWGTASTGTAIASLSGAAATNATLAFLGGGSLAAGGGGIALGKLVLTGGVAIVAIAGTGAVMLVYHIIDKKQEFARITRHCELMLRPDAIDQMMKNNIVPIR